MLYLFTGADRERARFAVQATVMKRAAGAELVRITDTNSIADLEMALRGVGMFGGKRALFLDNVLDNGEMIAYLLPRLEAIAERSEITLMYQSDLSAALRKQLEKYAERSEKFELKKEEERTTIFDLANALRRNDKKVLWVSYMRELSKGETPEAILGVLFWGAKREFLESRGAAKIRAAALVASLAELPHESRREGVDLEYALERFVLSEH